MENCKKHMKKARVKILNKKEDPESIKMQTVTFSTLALLTGISIGISIGCKINNSPKIEELIKDMGITNSINYTEKDSLKYNNIPNFFDLKYSNANSEYILFKE